MKTICEIETAVRLRNGIILDMDYQFGIKFMIKYNFNSLGVIASYGDGWDHVSVSRETKIPSHTEMEWIRELVFLNSETVVQFSVPRDQHINTNPYVLHMWRNHNQEYILPPRGMV